MTDATPLMATGSAGPHAAPLGAEHFHALVERTSKRLFRLAARLSGDPIDAQDILQESYLRAYRTLKLNAFDQRATIDTWLYSVVTNVALNWLRDSKRLKRREEQAAPREEATVGTAEARVALRELSALLEGLPVDQRAALVLKEIEGLSAREVAQVLNISEGAVEQRLVRARQTIRERGGR